MARHSTRITQRRGYRRVLSVGIVVIMIAFVVLIIHFNPTPFQQAATAVPSPLTVAETPLPDVATSSPKTDVAPPSPITSPTPTTTLQALDLKQEVGEGDVHFMFPDIGFNQVLVPLEVNYDQSGQTILPKDVRAYLGTNLSPKNCDVSGGEFIFGHTSIYTDYWGVVPFNAFKELPPGSSGQHFSIGAHQYVVTRVIVQPKSQLTTTKEFWCQPKGNVSIVSCYTQEEDGENIIVIGRPVA